MKEENPKVARVALSRMLQDREEPIRAHAARLRGQVGVCRFTKPCAGCSRVSDQGEERVADYLCIGLADSDIQADLLKDPNQNMTVEETLEVRATGNRSAISMATLHSIDKLEESQGGEAVGSTYRCQKATPIATKGTPSRGTPYRATPPRTTPNRGTPSREATTRGQACTYCGETGHGRSGPPMSRKTAFPAWGKTCRNCGKLNHILKMCRMDGEFENAISDGVYDLSSEGSNDILDHHVYDKTSQQWIRRKSKPHKLRAEAHTDDYRSLGYELQKGATATSIVAMADTGCQSCLAGRELLRQLHMETT